MEAKIPKVMFGLFVVCELKPFESDKKSFNRFIGVPLYLDSTSIGIFRIDTKK